MVRFWFGVTLMLGMAGVLPTSISAAESVRVQDRTWKTVEEYLRKS